MFLQIDQWGKGWFCLAFPAALPNLGCMLEFQGNEHVKQWSILLQGFPGYGQRLGHVCFPWCRVKGLTTRVVLLWPCCSSCCARSSAFHSTARLCKNAMYLHGCATAGRLGFASPKSCWALKPGSTYLVTVPEAQQLNASPHHWTPSFPS